MQRLLNLENASRTFCFTHEGMLAAAHIMAEHHLAEVLVLDGESRVVGSYVLGNHGIQFRQAVTVAASAEKNSVKKLRV